MTDWRSCYNCGFGACRVNVLSAPEPYTDPCDYWRKIPCPRCGGALSEVRPGGRRHCYSCHSEIAFSEDENETKDAIQQVPQQEVGRV